MSLSAQISITADNATPAIAELMASVEPARLAAVCRDPLRGFWRDRLKKYPRLPGKFAAFPSTGFGEKSGNSEEAYAGDGTVLLTANQQGLRLRYEGGTIRPVHAKVLCFGITEETYGKSYWEMMAQFTAKKVSVPVEGPKLKGKKTVKRTRTHDEAKAAMRKQFAFAKSVTFVGNLALVPTSDEFAEVGMAAISRSLAA